MGPVGMKLAVVVSSPCFDSTRASKSITHTQPKLPSPQAPPQGEAGAAFECMNRNARRGKKANHGKRPVSSARRKQKVRRFGKK